MRRRLLVLSFRRRFLARVLPGALLWAFVFVFLVGVVGMRLDIVLIVAIVALAIQTLLIWSTAGRRR